MVGFYFTPKRRHIKIWQDKKNRKKQHLRIFHLQNLNVMMTVMQYAVLDSI